VAVRVIPPVAFIVPPPETTRPLPDWLATEIAPKPAAMVPKLLRLLVVTVILGLTPPEVRVELPSSEIVLALIVSSPATVCTAFAKETVCPEPPVRKFTTPPVVLKRPALPAVPPDIVSSLPLGLDTEIVPLPVTATVPLLVKVPVVNTRDWLELLLAWIVPELLIDGAVRANAQSLVTEPPTDSAGTDGLLGFVNVIFNPPLDTTA